MAKKTYPGSCHCGAVQFEVDLDLGKGTTRCNCSVCAKARSWFALVEPADLRLERGEEALAEYAWTPAGRPHPNLHYRFCRTCGIRAFARGENDGAGKPFFAVSIAALDGADEKALASSIRYVDGRHDHYDRVPKETRAI
jgi:hypothetical protein